MATIASLFLNYASQEEWSQAWDHLNKVLTFKVVPLKDAWIQWGVDVRHWETLSPAPQDLAEVENPKITGVNQTSLVQVSRVLPSKTVTGFSTIALLATGLTSVSMWSALAMVPAFMLGSRL